LQGTDTSCGYQVLVISQPTELGDANNTQLLAAGVLWVYERDANNYEK